jgi:hypothetical protein
MKWLKKKLRNWVNEEDYITLDDRAIRARDEPDGECIRFKVFKASGGTVIQTDVYDRRADRQYNNLHVIVEGQDIGHEIGKILTYESLKL